MADKTGLALLVVDVQNDFCPGGSLAVAGGDRIVQVLNEYSEKFKNRGLPIFLSRDWHPQQTTHFVTSGGVWPVHCVMGTHGAEFHPALRISPSAVIISKGMAPHRDDYSALDGVDEAGRPLPAILADFGIRRLFIGGLTTEYCVKETALDALRQGYKVTILEDAVMGVNIKEGDALEAIVQMKKAGAEMTTLLSFEKYFE